MPACHRPAATGRSARSAGRVHGFLISGVGSFHSDPGAMMSSIGTTGGGPAAIRRSHSTCFARLASARVLSLAAQTPRARAAYGQRAAARSAAFYEFLISAVEKAIIRQSRVPPDPAQGSGVFRECPFLS